MDTQTLPLVTFGKYKGQPVTSLLNDSNYLEWCKQQVWFQKHTTIYNICVNQTITTPNLNSKTPEHNNIQNKFLDNKFLENFLRIVYSGFKYKSNIEYHSAKCEFEGEFNWDVIIDDVYYRKIQCKCNEIKDENCYNCKYDNDTYDLSNIYIEIKPLIGDDYPCILRKMKLQKGLTLNMLQKEKQDLDLLKDERHINMRNYHHKNIYGCGGIFVLFVKEYNSTNTTKEQLIEIFKQSNIRIIFFTPKNDNLQKQIISTPNENIYNIIQPNEQNTDLKDENKMLRETLIKAEERIMQLEKEIQILKTQHQPNTLKNYFGKKIIV